MSTADLRVESTPSDGDPYMVVKVFGDGPKALYQGYVAKGLPFAPFHSHPAVMAGEHSHPHDGPHEHPVVKLEPRDLLLRRDAPGMTEELRDLMVWASALHMDREVERRGVDPTPQIDTDLGAAIVRTLFGYMQAGMSRDDALGRISSRVTAVLPLVVTSMSDLLADLADVDIEVDMSEIERLGREQPLSDEEHSSLCSKLKAAGLPTSHYVANHDEDDKVVAGPFRTADEAASHRRALESHPSWDEVNLAVYEGFNVSGRVVAV